MPDTTLPPPFKAYIGEQPYVFASYAQADAEQVFPILAHLDKEGFRVWYDEGIDPGNEWPDEVAKALAGAAFLVVFISPRAVTSQNVRNEINFALNKHKAFVAVHIENTELPPGLELRMGDVQAILLWRLDDEHFRQKCVEAMPKSVRKEFKPRVDLLLNAYRVKVQVRDRNTSLPIGRAEVELSLVNVWRDSPSIHLAGSTIEGSGKTDQSGSVAFGILPTVIFNEKSRFVVTARAPGFVQQHTSLEYRSPAAIARMSWDAENVIVMNPGELDGVGVDETVTLDLQPTIQK